MRLINLNWSYHKGEGNVGYTKEFNKANIIVQLDMLQDCIFDLTNKYNELLADPESLKKLKGDKDNELS
jgi:hypothetical protein